MQAAPLSGSLNPSEVTAFFLSILSDHISLLLSSFAEEIGGYRLPDLTNIHYPLHITPFVSCITCVINFMIPKEEK